MRKNFNVIGLAISSAIAILSLSACTTMQPPMVSVMPMEDGSYKAISTAENEQLALSGSLRSAESTCSDRHLHHLITSVNTRFRGMPARTEDPTQQAAALVRYVNAPTFPSLTANDDYEVKLQFICG